MVNVITAPRHEKGTAILADRSDFEWDERRGRFRWLADACGRIRQPATEEQRESPVAKASAKKHKIRHSYPVRARY
jgi:hypothetical protein